MEENNIKNIDANTETADNPELIHEEQPKKKRKTGRSLRRSLKRIGVITLASALLLSASAFGLASYENSCSYAISSGDKTICYVKDRDSASAAVSKAVNKLARKDSEILLVSTGAGLKIERSVPEKELNGEIKSIDEAAECILKEAGDKSSDLNIDVVSVKSETETFTPDPKYKKDGTKLAGYTYVEDEGKDGKEQVTYVYTTSDGSVEEKNDIERTVISEGRRAKITKGVLGVPEGESWKTYDGNPVLNNGEDLVVSAKQYVGVLQYKLGGTSLVTGADCVGFVQAIYKLYGVKLSPNLKAAGRGVSYSEAKPGDIICYGHHYGIYAGNGKMVHAANANMDVCVSNVSRGRIVAVRRVAN